MRENTPEFALKVEECLVEYKEGANRWTDNIFNIISWVSGLTRLLPDGRTKLRHPNDHREDVPHFII